MIRKGETLMKKIMNLPENYVMEMCNGIASAHPEIAFNPTFKIMQKKAINQNKVTLISGGGCGHEPAHAGFIGEGMLDVAICGDVFASPSQIQVYQGIKNSASNKGTLLIIKNYSGDMMNFKNAAYLASEDGIEVDYVKVDDDIAVEDSLHTVGRRGVAGTVLVHKIAGAVSEEGKSLAEVKEIANKVIKNVKSIGFAFSSCVVPAKGTPTFDIAENEMEFGVGIHGEPGIAREPIAKSKDLAERMVKALMDEMKLTSADEICVLVNGFGGSPLSELYLLNNDVQNVLSEKNMKVARTFVGNYMTSIDMEGASISILKLDAELKKYLTAKADTPAFKVTGNETDTVYTKLPERVVKTDVEYGIVTADSAKTIANEVMTMDNIVYCVDKMSEIIIRNEVAFCDMDAHAGDGDFGMSVAKGFKQVKADWKEILERSSNISEFLHECSMIIMEYCGGASGPVWGSAFRAASKASEGKETVTLADFAEMMQASVKGIYKTGERSFGRGAVVGDKTLIDALAPYADSLTESAKASKTLKESFVEASKASVVGADKTAEITASMGRASSVGERSIGHPDAGAKALSIIFTEITETLS